MQQTVDTGQQTVVINHPLVQHKLTLMRQKDRSTSNFRRLLHEISMLMAYEVTRDMPTQLIEIETPLETMQAPVIDGKKTVFVVVMRAGDGFLDGMLDVVPGARVGHIGLYRDPKTLIAVEYYFKMPHGMEERDAIVLDPMLATGNSAVAAVERLKETRPRSIRFVSLLAAPEGLQRFHDAHPDVPVYTAAIDRQLDAHGYIVPGLGLRFDFTAGAATALAALTGLAGAKRWPRWAAARGACDAPDLAVLAEPVEVLRPTRLMSSAVTVLSCPAWPASSSLAAADSSAVAADDCTTLSICDMLEFTWPMP